MTYTNVTETEVNTEYLTLYSSMFAKVDKYLSEEVKNYNEEELSLEVV